MADHTRVITRLGDLPTGYFQMFTLAWYLYDLALTLDDEITYIWSRRIRWNATLFIATRYLTGLLLILSAVTSIVRGFSPLGCDIFGWFVGIGTFVVFFFVQLILQTRIYIMYNRSRTVLRVNICLFVLEIILASVVTALYFGDSTPIVMPPWVLGSCFTERTRRFAAVWAAPLAFEAYLAALALYKLKIANMLEGGSLLDLIIRDNVLYFVLNVVAMTLYLFLFAFSGLPPGVSIISVVHAAGAVGGTRIILSLLRAGDRAIDPSSWSEAEASGIVFTVTPRTRRSLARLDDTLC